MSHTHAVTDHVWLFEHVHGGVFLEDPLDEWPTFLDMHGIQPDFVLFHFHHGALSLNIRPEHQMLACQWEEVLSRAAEAQADDHTKWRPVEGSGWIYGTAVVTIDDPFT